MIKLVLNKINYATFFSEYLNKELKKSLNAHQVYKKRLARRSKFLKTTENFVNYKLQL